MIKAKESARHTTEGFCNAKHASVIGNMEKVPIPTGAPMVEIEAQVLNCTCTPSSKAAAFSHGFPHIPAFYKGAGAC